MSEIIEIPQITQAHYQVNVSWDFLEWNLERWDKSYGIQLEPDFQRHHVWDEQQKVKYVEWVLRGGTSGRDLLWNCPGWMKNNWKGPVVLVDGLQRISAVREFLKNNFSAFPKIKPGGIYASDLRKGDLFHADFIWHVNDLETRKQVLQWYIDVNEGGTVHTQDEMKKVHEMLQHELYFGE